MLTLTWRVDGYTRGTQSTLLLPHLLCIPSTTLLRLCERACVQTVVSMRRENAKSLSLTMAIFASKDAVRVPTESIWDYTLGAEEQTRSQTPIIFDVDDPDALHLSAADVAMHARRFAKTLTDVGIQPEDRVLFAYPSSIYSASFFLAATHLVGATFIPLSANVTASELQVIFEHSKPTAIVSHPGRLDLGRALKVSSEVPSPCVLCLDTSTPLPRLYSLAPEVKPNPHIGTQTSRPASRPCVILYTSGTSGTPKGWVYSEHTLLAGTVHLYLRSAANEADFERICSFRGLRRGNEATIRNSRPDRHTTKSALRTSGSALLRVCGAVTVPAPFRASISDARLHCQGTPSECEGMWPQRFEDSRVYSTGHITLERPDQHGSVATAPPYSCRREPAIIQYHAGRRPNG